MTDRRSIADILKATSIFGSLGEDDIAGCAAEFRPFHFEAGRQIFAMGDPGDRAYLVGEGLIRLSIATSGGGEFSVRVAGPTEMIGEFAVLDNAPRSADATAITEVEGWSISASHFNHLLESRAGLARAVIRHLCERLRGTTDQLEGIALHSIEIRLCRFLLYLLRHEETRPGKRIPLLLGYSQSELARLLGSSRSKLNVALGQLEKAGAIKRTPDRLYCDPALLQMTVDRADE